MAEIKVVLCLFFIFAVIPKCIHNFQIKVNAVGKTNNVLKSYQGSCIYNSDCGYGLKCIGLKCRCQSDEYWNNTYCETKLALYFKSNANYTTIYVDNHDGIRYNVVTNIAVIEKPTYYIYVGDSTNSDIGLIAQYDEFGNYIRSISPLDGIYGIEPINNSLIYVTRWTTTIMYIFDPNLNLINSKDTGSSTVQSPRFLRYNPSNGHFYVTDVDTHYVNAFDSGYNLIASECFPISETPFGIDFYQSSTLGSLVLVTTWSNNIQIVKLSDKTVYKTFNSICGTNDPFSLFVHQKSGYILISCYGDDRVQLWHTDGIDFVNTGKFLSITSPGGLTFDSKGRLLITNFFSGAFSILTLV